jgi:integrase
MARWGIYDVGVWDAVLSSVAPSTKTSYERIFLKFVSYVEGLGLNFCSMSIGHVLGFLKEFKGLSKSRVRTAVASLKFFLKVYNRLDLVNNPLLDMFSKGAQNLGPLPKEKNSIWDPNVVLLNIKNRPRPSSFLPLAREAIVLLLLATGWRVDDVWKLGCEVAFGSTMATFRFLEKRKCKIKGSYTVTQNVKRFASSPRICPVEAVRIFLERAKDVRGVVPFLFVTSKGNRPSKDSLRRWVCAELSAAGIQASAGSCRSASTSLASERSVSIDVIMRSAGWSSENTFRRFYQRKVSRLQDPINLAEAF